MMKIGMKYIIQYYPISNIHLAFISSVITDTLNALYIYIMFIIHDLNHMISLQVI